MSQFERTQSAEPCVGLHAAEFLVGEVPRLDEEIDVDAALADVVQKSRYTQIEQSRLTETEPSAHGKTEDAHVDRVRVGVVVITPEPTESHHRHFVVQHLIDDTLDDTCDVPESRRATHAGAFEQFLGHRDRLLVGPLGGQLPSRFILEVSVSFRARPHSDVSDTPLQNQPLELMEALSVVLFGLEGQ